MDCVAVVLFFSCFCFFFLTCPSHTWCVCSYFSELQVKSGGTDAVKVADQRKSPGPRRKVRRRSVPQSIGQQQKDARKDEDTPAVRPLQAHQAGNRLHSSASRFCSDRLEVTERHGSKVSPGPKGFKDSSRCCLTVKIKVRVPVGA